MNSQKLKGQPGSHVPPHGIAPHYFMFAHAYAALAIEALPESDRPPLRTKMQELLLQTRDDGGGWTASEFSAQQGVLDGHGNAGFDGSADAANS